jgi:diguanylate cyclase (GGDEF)-like protein
VRNLLGQCEAIDALARDVYSRLADTCEDPEIRDLMLELAADEQEHCTWWSELLDAWERGLLPDIVGDDQSVVADMETRLCEMRLLIPEDTASLSCEEALTIAAQLEFYMIDPIFGELIELVEPATAEVRNASYQDHLGRLTDAIIKRAPDGSHSALLGRLLERVWHDNRLLASYANRDGLTGLLNRRALNAHMAQWTAWAMRYGRALGVLLMDVDFFKDVNDTYGHPVGDRALLAVATAVRDTVRDSDLVARYGGDEFAVIAPEADSAQLSALGTRILAAVRDIPVAVNGEELSLSVSIGAATASDGLAEDPHPAERLFSAADRSLYAAKEAGRDRVGEPIVLEVSDERV